MVFETLSNSLTSFISLKQNTDNRLVPLWKRVKMEAILVYVEF